MLRVLGRQHLRRGGLCPGGGIVAGPTLGLFLGGARLREAAGQRLYQRRRAVAAHGGGMLIGDELLQLAFVQAQQAGAVRGIGIGVGALGHRDLAAGAG